MLEQRLYLDALLELSIDPAVVASCDGLSLPAGETSYHFASSPILHDGMVIVQVDVQEISQSLLEGYFSATHGDNETFRRTFAYAKQFHEIYRRRQIFNTGVNQGAEARMEVFPRYFDVYAGQILAATIFGMAGGGAPEQAALLYQAVPTDLQQVAYVFLENHPMFLQWKETPRNDGSNRADFYFPQPPDMSSVREDIRQRLETDAPVGQLEAQ